MALAGWIIFTGVVIYTWAAARIRVAEAQAAVLAAIEAQALAGREQATEDARLEIEARQWVAEWEQIYGPALSEVD